MVIGCQTLMRSLYLGASAVWQPDTDNSPAAAAANALRLMRVFIALRLQANDQAQAQPLETGLACNDNVQFSCHGQNSRGSGCCLQRRVELSRYAAGEWVRSSA